MHLINYIKELRSVLGTIINAAEHINDHTIVEHAHAALERTADFATHEINRGALVRHIHWLEQNFEGEAETSVVQILRKLLQTQRHVLRPCNGELYLGEHLLCTRSHDGDIITIDAERPDMPLLYSMLYDHYQWDESIKEGDEFELNGRVIASCVDVHVIANEGHCAITLPDYLYDREQLQELIRSYHVQIVDYSGAPHFIVFKGRRNNLLEMIKAEWPEEFTTQEEAQQAIADTPFRCTWAEGHAHQGTSLKPITFFTEANGYAQDSIGSITAMQPGQSIVLNESGIHEVKRLY